MNRKKWFAYLQYVLPKEWITLLLGKLASTQHKALKQYFIRQFIHHYKIDMRLAKEEDMTAYASFNDFFIRQLKPNLRPIVSGHNDIASPVDGIVAQFGRIHQNRMIQAKGSYFTLETLLAEPLPYAPIFQDGTFLTLYLAPHHYHRVHMPLAGELSDVIYVPGKLFSVNRITSEIIPQLYSRNERLICIFNTAIGKMAVIFVGAMIVGSIRTTWLTQPIRQKQIAHLKTPPLRFNKGDELGHFQLGSTIILLFEKNKIDLLSTLTSDQEIKYGELLGHTL